MSDELCEEQVFPSLHSNDKFGHNATRDIRISLTLYFNQGLLKFWTFHQVQVITFLTGRSMSSTTQVYQ